MPRRFGWRVPGFISRSIAMRAGETVLDAAPADDFLQLRHTSAALNLYIAVPLRRAALAVDSRCLMP